MKYTIVCNKEIDKLVKDVNAHLTEGWRIIGQPFVVAPGIVGQAMYWNHH